MSLLIGGGITSVVATCVATTLTVCWAKSDVRRSVQDQMFEVYAVAVYSVFAARFLIDKYRQV